MGLFLSTAARPGLALVARTRWQAALQARTRACLSAPERQLWAW